MMQPDTYYQQLTTV